jgi:cytochrome c556
MSRLVVAAVIGLITALPAAAQFRNAEAAVEYRQAVMQMQAFHFGRIAAMANGKMPFDAKVAAEDAALLATIDKLPYVAFGPGTDMEASSKAKPAIWSNRAKFDAEVTTFVDAVAALNVAAKTGNLDQIKPAVGGVGKSCKGCHDEYKSK